MDEPKLNLTPEELRNWNLVEHFRKILLPRLKAAPKHRTESDPRRHITADAYFSLFLFSMFNPLITSMRGLCAITHLDKMRQICPRPIAPSSFSECQHLFDGAILGQIVHDLAERCRGQLEGFGDRRVREAVKGLTIVDGTVMRAVARMGWAPAAGFGKSVRLHLHYSVFDQVPVDWSITPGSTSEPGEWKKKLKRNEFYVVDRGYSRDLLYLKQLQKWKVDFVVRYCGNVRRTPKGEARELTEEDRKAGVISDRMEELGCLGGGPTLRVVEIETAGKNFLLFTSREDLPACVIGTIYRYRWQIELYFKWIKTMLPCGHWLAESPEGVNIQVYCVMIASLLLMLWTGKRPTKRQMEALWFYWTGFATETELLRILNVQKIK